MAGWAEFIQNPSEERLATAQWLLLKAIASNPDGLSTSAIMDELDKASEKLPTLFIMWSYGYDFLDILVAQQEFELVKQAGEDLWKITDKGKKLLDDTQVLIPSDATSLFG